MTVDLVLEVIFLSILANDCGGRVVARARIPGVLAPGCLRPQRWVLADPWLDVDYLDWKILLLGFRVLGNLEDGKAS